ncbi:hypothetical protein ACKS0A_01590 [Histoplasma ohiense]
MVSLADCMRLGKEDDEVGMPLSDGFAFRTLGREICHSSIRRVFCSTSACAKRVSCDGNRAVGSTLCWNSISSAEIPACCMSCRVAESVFDQPPEPGSWCAE